MSECKHEWTAELYPGPETRWCAFCGDTETEVELATLRAEVKRLREAARQVHALALTGDDPVHGWVDRTLLEIHKITKGMVAPHAD